MKHSDTHVKDIEYRGYNIEVHTDFDPPNPRKEFDNLGIMTCFHPRYDLGDEHSYKDGDDFFKGLAIWIDPTVEDRIEYWDNGNGWRRLMNLNPNEACAKCDKIVNKIIGEALSKAVMLPLYLYDHSYLRISSGSWHGRAQHAEWDSGRVGYIYITPEKIREEYGWKKLTKARRAKIAEYLDQEVKTYDDYLSGSVYGYNISAADKDEDADEEVDDDCNDSCWGFFGYDHEKSGLLEYARNAIDCHIERKREEAEAEEREQNEREFINFMQSCHA